MGNVSELVRAMVRARLAHQPMPPLSYFFKEADLLLQMAVWLKGTPIPGRDFNIWMQDPYGAIIKWDDHGDRDTAYGWEIDHIFPRCMGGTREIDNLQPLHWRNNVRKGDQFPYLG